MPRRSGMKFGSVRFFKTLIKSVIVLLIVVPVALAIVLGVLYSREKARADQLESATLAEMAQLLQEGGSEELPESLFWDLPEGAISQASFAYQSKYPHLYAQRPAEQTAPEKTCYLTFDDGPSDVTLRILDVLAEEDVKATFFVTGRNSEVNKGALQAAANAGHSIGIHTYSHDYQSIYASVDDYLEDFDKIYERVLDATGTPPSIFRFPGGSINVYNGANYTSIIAEMTRRGFVFYDWNAAGDDAVAGGISAAQVTENVLKSAAGQDRLIVLLHDRVDNGSTAAALPDIIDGLREEGYRFAALTNEVEPITFFYTGR